MTRKRIILLAFLFLMALSLTPVTYAQTELPSLGEIFSKLAPRSGTNLLFDIMLYLIFFMGLITAALVPDKQLLASLIMTGVMGMAIISKLEVFTPDHFATLILNAGMFTLPMVVAGMVRARHGTPKAMAPAAFTGLLGGAYFFLFWALVQRSI